MPAFRYRAYDSAGKERSGVLDAVSLKDASRRLKKEGLFPKEIAEPSREGGLFKGGSRVPAGELAALTRQLGVLVGAGTPLLESLSALSGEEYHPALKKSLNDIRERISAGASLASAFGGHPRVFSEMYVRTVEAAEASGTLESALTRLADFLESRAALYGKIRGALTYPAVMTVVGSAVLVFLVIFVIPRITGIFDSTGQSLPLVTRLLLFVVDAFASYWFVLPFAAGALAWGLSRYIATEKGKAAIDGLVLRAPLIGRLAGRFYAASFARTLGSLLSSGIPILGSLELTRKVLNNAVFGEIIKKAEREITEGGRLSASLKGSKALPAPLVHMIATGERSGELDRLLLKAADSYEKEFEASVSKALSLMEPAIVLIMGAVVGFIVLAILLPIFELNRFAK